MDPIFGFPTVIRFSWKTTENLLTEAVPGVWTRDEEDGDQPPPLKKTKPKANVARSHFFASRGIEVCQDFDS